MSKSYSVLVDSQRTASAVNKVLQELYRSCEVQPEGWPTCAFTATSIIQEELGELSKALLDYKYNASGEVQAADIYTEAIQLAAMAIKFLIHFVDYEGIYTGGVPMDRDE